MNGADEHLMEWVRKAEEDYEAATTLIRKRKFASIASNVLKNISKLFSYSRE